MLCFELIAALLLLLPVLPAARGENVKVDEDCEDVKVDADHALGRGVSGRQCMAPCAAGGGRCITSDSGTMTTERCYALQYYTALYNTDRPLCAGPCGEFVYPGRNHCLVDATRYDLCNPRTEHTLVIGALTWEGELCAGPCYDSRVCLTASGEYAGCTPKTQHYIRAHHTWNGASCDDRCERRGRARGLMCHGSWLGLALCAPPARFVMHAADTEH